MYDEWFNEVMKRFLKYFVFYPSLAVIVFCILGLLGVIVSDILYPVPDVVKSPSEANFEAIQEVSTRPYDVCSEGDSMLPTIPEERTCHYLDKREPRVGDIISFDCLDDFCDPNHMDGGPVDGEMKRLTQIRLKDGKPCYWVEGDNKKVSYDSRYHGCIPEDKISIDGVVILGK